MKTYKTVLSIAGSDSIGGAGIQADIKTCCALGVYAMTVVTAITAQNTCGVVNVEPCDTEMLRSQLWTVLSDVHPDAVKIGMVPDGEAVSIIADAIRHFNLKNVVVDPVLVSTSGRTLSGKDYIQMLCEKLIPISTLLTPNIPEAATLTGMPASNADDMRKIAMMMSQNYGVAVFLKGGHLSLSNYLVDVLATPDGGLIEISHPFVDTKNTHGTGCSLSSAIAAKMAGGETVADAVHSADDWLYNAIAAGADYHIGNGHGPINHLFNIIQS
jgi:hydroxymethylpyrimidine/phosphomethylpyrimidine kinase